jgi:hypothetical protein
METPRSTESVVSREEGSPEPIGSHPILLTKNSREGSELQETNIEASTPYAFIWYLHNIAKLPFQLPDWLHKESLITNLPPQLGPIEPPCPPPEVIQRYYSHSLDFIPD